MIMIWTGWGVVVAAIFVAAIAVGAILAAQFNAEGAAQDVLVGLAMIAGGVATWFVGKRMNRNAERKLVDPNTGEEVIVRSHHTFFFVKVEWWGPVMVGAGIVWLVLGITS